ncbi:trypsin-like peptidase domain-containing protein [Brooklawnia sp.]|uniref:S1C family serine protease n=1 Tax=Brooklawnia sp. TaxID=2699740 RepID=UPI00311E092C
MSQPYPGGRPDSSATPQPGYAAGTVWGPPSGQPWAPPGAQPWSPDSPSTWNGPVQWQPAGVTSQQPRKSRRTGIWAVATVLLVAVAVFVLLFVPNGTPMRSLPTAGRPQIPRSDNQPIPTYSTAVTAKMSSGIVLITGELDGGFAAGTGIVISESGLVLTNYHVVSGTTNVMAMVADDGRSYQADLLGRNVWADVALLQLEGADGLTTAQIAPGPAGIGDRVVAVGNGDGGGALLATGGSVTDLNAVVTLESAFGGYGFEDASGMIQSTAGAIPGYSGGPTFNDATEVVGVTSAGQDAISDQMVTYSIPIAAATAITDDITAGRQSEQTRVGPAGWLGVSFGTRNVAVLTAVDPGSPAAEVGLSAGSTITSFGGQAITSASGFLKTVESFDPGDIVDITWQDDQGQPRDSMVTLGTSPTN